MSSKQASAKKPIKAKKKAHINVPLGVAHIKASFNNTIVTITDQLGRVISWASAGRVGYNGSRKSSAFAASQAASHAGKEATDVGMREVDVKVKGPGSGRESAVKALQSSGLEIRTIEDVTPIPHNGCRARKRRRV